MAEQADTGALLSKALEEAELEKRENQGLRRRLMEVEAVHAEALSTVGAERSQAREFQVKLQEVELALNEAKKDAEEVRGNVDEWDGD